jgi:phenylalanyl-tRNA synthetase beta chain
VKISYNWLKEYLDFNLTPTDLAEVLTQTGLEVEDVTRYESVQGGLAGVVIGEIVACERHPDADKLQVTQVNVGLPELLQIVCGAPNCRVGLRSPIALVGTTLYPSTGDPLTIKKAKIRGVESQGMICADDELGLGNSHDGIMELKADTPIGMPAAAYFGVTSDWMLEIGLTPNRSDAFSHIGVARDLAAALAAVYKINLPLCKPTGNISIPTTQGSITVSVLDNTLCPRYSSIEITGVAVAPSPQWMQDRLKAIGLRPINNIVDITNYVLHEYGQPLHAFDAAQIKGGKITVKTLPDGTRFKTLDEVERILTAHDLMICDEAGGLCIAGVFGGIASGVTAGTTHVFLESAHFHPTSVRKTATRHQLRTDASQHFEKTCDINITTTALLRAADLICQYAGGKIASPLTDIYPTPVPPHAVAISVKRINQLAGASISTTEIKNILQHLEIAVNREEGDMLHLLVPTCKTEVTREADILEEILRIRGYNSIPIPTDLRAALSYSPAVDHEAIQTKVAAMLTGAGFQEISTNSISQSKYELDPTLTTQQVKLINSQTAELDVMRTSMLYSGLEVIAYNQNHRVTDMRLYETGKTYHLEAGKYVERKHICIYLTGRDHSDTWLAKPTVMSFYHLRSYVEQVLHRLGVHTDAHSEAQHTTLDYGMHWSIGGQVVATLGQVDRKLAASMDIKQPVYYADIDMDILNQRSAMHHVQYKAVSKYPIVRRDLAMIIADTVPFSQVEQIATMIGRKMLRSVSLFDVYKGDKIAAGKKSYAVSFTFGDAQRTLTDEEIDKMMTKLMAKYETELQAEIRKA